jgi:hypothetical protein
MPQVRLCDLRRLLALHGAWDVDGATEGVYGPFTIDETLAPQPEPTSMSQMATEIECNWHKYPKQVRFLVAVGRRGYSG